MKHVSIIILITYLISSCNLFDQKKKAITICQESKVLLNNSSLGESIAFSLYGFSQETTWLDFANKIAQKSSNKKYDWSAEETKNDAIYLVSFADEKKWGYRWEVDTNQKIVKFIDKNEYLIRKYGLSRMSKSNDFEITKITRDTLKVSKSSKPEIYYEYRGRIKNNTDKSIIDADLKGTLKLIFEEKVIEEKSGYNYGIKRRISKSKPWKPNTEIEFKLKTNGIDIIYADYVPPYVIFEVTLEANDPIGFKFNKNIKEVNLEKKWEQNILRSKNKINTSEE